MKAERCFTYLAVSANDTLFCTMELSKWPQFYPIQNLKNMKVFFFQPSDICYVHLMFLSLVARIWFLHFLMTWSSLKHKGLNRHCSCFSWDALRPLYVFIICLHTKLPLSICCSCFISINCYFLLLSTSLCPAVSFHVVQHTPGPCLGAGTCVSGGPDAKNTPAMWETHVWSLGGGDLLEKGMATHSSILFLENPMDRGAWWATVHEVTKSDTTERLTLSLFHFFTCVYLASCNPHSHPVSWHHCFLQMVTQGSEKLNNCK